MVITTPFCYTGYSTKKFIELFQCERCSLGMVGNDVDDAPRYVDGILTYFLEDDLRFDLAKMAEFVCACFAILDNTDKFTARHKSSERILETYSPK